MYFKIDPPGSNYTRVQIDVPNGQLEEIIRAIHGARTDPEEARPRNGARRLHPTGPSVAKPEDDGPSGGSALRIGVVEGDGEDVAVGVVLELTNSAFEQFLGRRGARRDAADGGVRGDKSEREDVAHMEAQRGGQALARALDEVEGQRGVELRSFAASIGLGNDLGAVHGQGSHGLHASSCNGCRCAGAARPDGAGEAEPTKTEALLEEAVELLKSVALSVAPPVISIPKNAAFAGRVKPEDLSRGVWSIPADDMGVSFAGTTLADEDACRRIDGDVDQDGPDCEGPDGGESA